MRNFKILAAAAAASFIPMTSAMAQGTETNELRNVVEMVGACDIVAIGVDFGINGTAIPATGIVSASPNTAAGAVNVSAAHPDRDKDGGAGAVGGDDELRLLVNGVEIPGSAALLGTVVSASPGVFVACTATPDAISIEGADLASTSLPTGPGAPVPITSKMSGVGNGATAANQVDYSMNFVPVVVPGGDLGLFIATYISTVNTIPNAQVGNTIVPGYYTDVLTATVEF